jgi:quaternary ammonium compound-resistance protein SugE
MRQCFERLRVAWIYLVLAGIFEIGWPLGFKLAQSPGYKGGGIALSVVSMMLSGFLLFIAQRDIPIGTAYAVWTGIGALGTFLIGVLFFGDPSTMMRFFGAFLILGGVIVLKLSHVS